MTGHVVIGEMIGKPATVCNSFDSLTSHGETHQLNSLKNSCCGMYIPLSDDKHRKVRGSSKKHTGNLRQNAV